MKKEIFVSYRKQLGLTQKELAQLLVTSVKAIHSYEQGWRNIPENIERQLFFLISRQQQRDLNPRECWIIKKCPPERKKQCPAWKFNAGRLCWFINGTVCEGSVQKNWSDKMQLCRDCEIFKPIINF